MNKVQLNMNHILYNIVFLLVFLSIKQWEPENPGFNEKFYFYEKLQQIVVDLFLQENVLQYSFINRSKQEIAEELLQDPMIRDRVIDEKIVIHRGNYMKWTSTVKKVDSVFILRVIHQTIVKPRLFVRIPRFLQWQRENRVELLMNTFFYFMYHYSFDNQTASELYYKKKLDEFIDELEEEFQVDLQSHKYAKEYSWYSMMQYLGGCFGCVK